MSGIFSYNQNNQKKEEPRTNSKFMGLINLIARRAWDLSKLNVISFIFYIPMFAVVWVATYWFIPAEGAQIFNYQVYTPADAALIDLLRRLTLGSVFITVPILVLGPVSAGATYVYRNMVKGQPVFIWGDMLKTMKGFFWKSLLIMVIDIIVLFLSGAALQFYPQVLTGVLEAVVTYIILIFLLLFFMMHFYIYQLLVEYNLKIVPLYRYSFVFALLRFFPNLIILILCVFITLAPFQIHILVGNGLLIFITLALCGIIINYYTWPAIEKHFEPLVKR